MNELIPVILSGGSGTRLWPLSREQFPKQLLSLGCISGSLLQATVERACAIADSATSPILVCNEEHRFLVAEQVRQIGIARPQIVIESVGRNTAPAVAVAALAAVRGRGDNYDPSLLVLPADHVVGDPDRFKRAVAIARDAAAAGKLVTFGVVPTRPEAGFGYIKKGEPHRQGAFKVERFVEKPDTATAEVFVRDGAFLWNSGMFLFRARAYLDQLRRFAPDILSACAVAVDRGHLDLDFLRVDPSSFGECRSESIDYAVFEKTDDAVVVPLDSAWNDVGSWSALQDAYPTDADGNVLRGDVVAEDTLGSFVYSDSRLVAVLGLKDCVVVETKDAVLVTPKNRVQDVKKVVSRLRKAGRSEHVSHREVARPWGSYDSLENGPGYQVKRLSVKPGAAMSLQLHHHRAEHWIVVGGTARITRGEETFILTENQSTYIPLGVKHRIENPGKVTLHIIEVQSGRYLGEDDIVRFDDKYGRN